MLSKNSKLIAMKQAFAFCIDVIIVSLPLIVAPSLESFPIFILLWFIYIPFSEFYFSQTLGMKIVGTKILNSNDMQSRIELGTALRRQIARISMMWGVVGWIFMFLGEQYISDYVVMNEKYTSIENKQSGLVEAHQNKQYKVLFFVFVIAFIADELRRFW